MDGAEPTAAAPTHGRAGSQRPQVRSIAGPARREHLAHPVLADLEQPLTPKPQSGVREATAAASRANWQRRIERFWPLWLTILALSLAYTAWCASQFNAFGVMIGLHLILAFGLLSWTPSTFRGLGRWWRRLRGTG